MLFILFSIFLIPLFIYIIKYNNKMKEKNESLEYLNKEYIITKKQLFIDKVIYLNLEELDFLELNSLSIRHDFINNEVNIDKLKLLLYMKDDVVIEINNTLNSFKILKGIKKFKANKFEEFIQGNQIFLMDNIKECLEKSLDDIDE